MPSMERGRGREGGGGRGRGRKGYSVHHWVLLPTCLNDYCIPVCYVRMYVPWELTPCVLLPMSWSPLHGHLHPLLAGLLGPGSRTIQQHYYTPSPLKLWGKGQLMHAHNYVHVKLVCKRVNTDAIGGKGPLHIATCGRQLHAASYIRLTVKSGPMSTSNPKSVKPVAMTLYPRSWPSSPTLDTRIRGLRPSFFSNSCNMLYVGRYLLLLLIWNMQVVVFLTNM